MEWWWNQPNVPAVKTFVDAISPAIGNKKPTARHWMAYVSLHAVKLAAEKAKSLEAVKMAHALSDMELPPEVALSPNKVKYRAGDHQLMSDIFVGQVQQPGAGRPRRPVQGRVGRSRRAGRRIRRGHRLQDQLAGLGH